VAPPQSVTSGVMGGAVRIPPAYDSLPSTTESQSGRNAYSTLNESLDEIAAEEEAMQNPLPLNAQEVFSITENVQIYFISKDDNVSAPTYPTFLRVVVISQGKLKFSHSFHFHIFIHIMFFPDQPEASAKPPAFLQVGDWTYPLIPGQSPIYHSQDGSYVFPDLRADATAGNENSRKFNLFWYIRNSIFVM
jgi:spartin